MRTSIPSGCTPHYLLTVTTTLYYCHTCALNIGIVHTYHNPLAPPIYLPGQLLFATDLHNGICVLLRVYICTHQSLFFCLYHRLYKTWDAVSMTSPIGFSRAIVKLSVVALAGTILAVPGSSSLPASPKMGTEVEQRLLGWSVSPINCTASHIIHLIFA